MWRAPRESQGYLHPQLPSGRSRARRPLARCSGPLPLVRAYPAGTAPLARRRSHTPPSPPWASNLRAHGLAPAAAKLQAHPRRCPHLLLHLYPCLPPGHPRPRRPLAALVGLCPACTAQQAHCPRTPLPCRSGAPRPRAGSHAPAASALHTRVPADPRTCIPSCRPAARALADRSPPIRRAPSPPRPVVPRLHRPAARNPLAHPALAAPGRAGLSPEASVTKGRE